MSHVRETLARMGRDVSHEVVVNVLAALALAAGAFVLLGGRIDDLYTVARGTAPTTGEVALVVVDEETLYLWDPADPEPEITPRGLLAQLVWFLRAAGAHVVVLDILTDRTEPGDDALADAVRAHGRVVAAERFSPGPPGDPIPFAAGSVLGDDAVGAYANLGLEEQTLFSGEMLVRAVPLVSRVARARLTGPFPSGLVGAFQDDDVVTPSIALAAAWLHRSTEAPGALGAALETACRGAPLRCDGIAPLGLPAVPVNPADPLPINFRGPEGADGIPVVSGARLLRSMGESALARMLGVDVPVSVPDDLKAMMDGKIVVIGRVDAASSDRFVTPYAFPAMLSADMTGSRIHAQLIDTVLSGRHVRRMGSGAAWVLSVGLGGLCAWSARRIGDGHLMVWGAVGVVVVGAGTLLFVVTDGVVFDVGPTLGVMVCVLTGVHLYRRNE